jgi:two-component system cell cycle sensor histidine kinase/response regulator CckA
MLEHLIQVKGSQKVAIMPANGYVCDPDRNEEPRENSPVVTETVLVVDDETLLRTLVSRGLRRQRYRVLSAANGLQALQLAERHPGRIDALVTDLMMPHVGGTELARRLTAIRPQLKVLYMSGCVPDEFDAAQLMTRGRAFLQKPFTMDQLWQKLRETLDPKSEGHPPTSK